MTNTSGHDNYDVIYVADEGTSLQNYDKPRIGNGPADVQLAFLIDNVGLNTPLRSESMTPDLIWQNNETWVFVIQDFVGAGGGPPAPFDSIGIAGNSAGWPPSTGSILGVPEPSSLLLAALGLMGFGIYCWRRRE